MSDGGASEQEFRACQAARDASMVVLGIGIYVLFLGLGGMWGDAAWIWPTVVVLLWLGMELALLGKRLRPRAALRRSGALSHAASILLRTACLALLLESLTVSDRIRKAMEAHEPHVTAGLPRT